MPNSALAAPEKVRIDRIIIGDRRRPLDEKKVVQFENSIRDQGFLQPIHLYPLHGLMEGRFKLVAGRHRLQALVNLGQKHVMAIMLAREQAVAWEAAENLFRNDLSELERSIEIVKYAEGRKRLISVRQNKKELGGIQPHNRGFNQLAKATGIDRKRIAEAFLHAKLPASTRRLVRADKRLDKRSFLNAICRIGDEAEQLAAIEERLRGSKGDPGQSGSSKEVNREEPTADDYIELRGAWMSSNVRKIFRQKKPHIQKKFIDECLRG